MEKEEIVQLLHYRFRHRRINHQFFVELYNQDIDCSLISEVIKENFKFILTGCTSFELPLILKELYKHSDIRLFMIHNTTMMLKILKEDFFLIPVELQRKHFINQHFLKFIKELPADCFFSMATQENFIEERNRGLLNSFLNEYKEEYVTFLLGRHLGNIYTTEELFSLMPLLTMLVDEILQTENLRYVDIKQLSPGSFSDVIEIGSKILKVGEERLCYHIPNDSHILKPLIRVNLKDISSICGTIEVVEKVNTDFVPSTFELYSLYESLREQGIIWLDIKANNVGLLLKDNTYHYDKALSFDPVTRGMIGEDSFPVLSKGELVVIDSDHLFFEEDLFQNSDMYKVFKTSDSFYYETLYQENLKYKSLFTQKDDYQKVKTIRN